MNTGVENIEINFLDHVAIRVKDLNVSVRWYQNVLGLKKVQPPAWGEFPIFMMANKSGIAIFPAELSDSPYEQDSKNVKIDHFAFNVDNLNFNKAVRRYEELKLDYEIQDHHYFKSIYTSDPDNHIVELTTIMVNEEEFYRG